MMSIELLIKFLGWTAVLNFALLIWWGLFILFAHDWVYRLHTKWFSLSKEQFDAVHYAGIAFYKMGLHQIEWVEIIGLPLLDRVLVHQGGSK